MRLRGPLLLMLMLPGLAVAAEPVENEDKAAPEENAPFVPQASVDSFGMTTANQPDLQPLNRVQVIEALRRSGTKNFEKEEAVDLLPEW